MIRLILLPFLAFTLFTHASYIKTAKAQHIPYCDDRLVNKLTLCSAFKCKQKDKYSSKNIIHHIRGVNTKGECTYIIRYTDKTENICHFSREEIIPFQRNLSSIVNSPEGHPIAEQNLDKIITSQCALIRAEDNMSKSNETLYYELGGQKFPYIYSKDICVNKNALNNIYLTTGKYGFTFKVNAIKTFKDASSPYGELSFPYQDFLKKTCAKLDRDIFRFSHIELNLKAITPTLDPSITNGITVKILNPSLSTSEEFINSTNDTYLYLTEHKKDSFSPAAMKNLTRKTSLQASDDFYKIEKSRERPVEMVKPFVLLPKDQYKTRAGNIFAFECTGAPAGTICSTKWVWGANIAISLENLPNEPTQYKPIVDAVNQYVDAAYVTFNQK
ncbi:MAG: hypothetical protein CL561_03675 [Alphaproteobacteria bacterium]|nr:hypothetical protein [Alphaproteobacteria bacterium]|tara:strand:- start:865 stop:2025 length:1161 start_codon:yes stop_codon:yes gene_type:complete